MKSDVTAITNAFVITERIPMPSRIPYQIPVQQGEYVSSRKNEHQSAWDTARSEALVPTTWSLFMWFLSKSHWVKIIFLIEQQKLSGPVLTGWESFITPAQLVSMYPLASKSSWHANATQWHTAPRHHLGFLAHPQPSDISCGRGKQRLWSRAPLLRTTPEEG